MKSQQKKGVGLYPDINGRLTDFSLTGRGWYDNYYHQVYWEFTINHRWL